MNRIQLAFSLGCGIAFIGLGALLAINGIADWGLGLVGLLVSGVTVASWRPQFGSAQILKAPAARPRALRV